MTFTSPQIPPNTPATGSLGPFPTPTHGQPGPGTFTIACSAHIKASPRACLEVLLKAAEYPAWNRYCRKCIIEGQPDDGNGNQSRKDKKEKKKKDPKPKAGKPREPVDLPVAVPQAESTVAATAPEATLSSTKSHSSSGATSSLWSDLQSLPNLIGPEFLRLGTRFTFEVHMDPLAGNGTVRDTALEVSRLERIDEVVEKDVAKVVEREAGVSLPGADAGVGTGAAGGSAETGTAVVTKDSSSGGQGGGGDGGAASTAEESKTEPTANEDVKPTTDPKQNQQQDQQVQVPSSPQNTTANANNNRKKIRRTGFRIAWKARPSLLIPNWLLRCERVQEFIEVHPPFGADDEPETAYQCWETFYGVLAPVVKAAAGSQVMKGFDVWTDGLRKRAEEVEGSK